MFSDKDSVRLPSSSTPSQAKSRWSRWLPEGKFSTIAFIVSTVVSVIISILQIYIIYSYSQVRMATASDTSSARLWIVVIDSFIIYRACFLFACIFGAIMTATALISKNGVQVISLGIYSIGEAAFSIIQFFQSRFYTYQDSTNTIVFHDKLASSAGYTSFCQFSEIAVVALTTALTVFLWAMTIYLYNEINWVLYNRMGPSLLKKRYFYLYQVFLSVVKFNAFFLVIYGAQITGAFVLNAYLVANFGEHLLAVLLGVSIPLLLITITMGFVAVNYESFVALCVFEVGCIGTIAGIIFVIIRTYNSQSNGSSFAIMRVFLLFFSILSLLLTLAAGIIGILIRQSFGMGLSKHLFNPLKRNEHEADEKDNSDIVLE